MLADLPDWKDLPISLYGRNSASGTYAYLKKHALFKGDYKDTVKEQPGGDVLTAYAVARDGRFSFLNATDSSEKAADDTPDGEKPRWCVIERLPARPTRTAASAPLSSALCSWCS